MPKLHLKPTPEEEAARRLRKQEKKEARRRKRGYEYDDTEPSGSTYSHKRPRTTSEPGRKWASSDEDERQPTSSSNHASCNSKGHEPNQDELTAEMEEMRFREKLFDAFTDDDRLDSLEANLNGYTHVPDQWQTGPSETRSKAQFKDDEWLNMDPQAMDEEEYAEWIRMGMYRKTHVNEYAEQQRQKAAQASRRAEERKKRKETARLAKTAEEEWEAKKREREARRWARARDAYHEKWKVFLSSGNDTLGKIGFIDIPWPILDRYKERSNHRSREVMAVTVDHLTVDAIAAFLLPGDKPEGDRSRKEVLRETFLRFHPDKFEGRFLKIVRTEEQDVVRDGIGRVVQALNTLMPR